jgi:glycosyltransferase involved in cell wall biosynthesis
MKNNERWLILSHAFNMDGRAASQTITDKIPFLLGKNIDLIIVSASTGKKDSALPHYQIFPLGGAGLKFDLRHYLKGRLNKGIRYKILIAALSLILTPFILVEKIIFGLQSQASWAIPAYISSLYLIYKYKINVIYSTGGAYSAHLAGLWLKKTTNLKWIVEIHDPLVKPEHAPSTRDEKFQFELEKNICTYGDLIWWFTEGALNSAQKRNPHLGSKGHCIVPGANPPLVHYDYQKRNKIIYAHFGSLSKTRSLDVFLKALANYLQSHPDKKNMIEVHIYGADLDSSSNQVINTMHLNENIQSHGRIEYDSKTGLTGREQVLQKMQAADFLVLTHGQIPDCAEYIPSKVYEYFWAKRPIFGITHKNPQLDTLILDRNGYIAHTEDEGQIVKNIERSIHDWETDNIKMATLPPIGVDAATQIIIEKTRGLSNEN